MNFYSLVSFLFMGGFVFLLIIALIAIILVLAYLRIVVKTNDVHIVQSSGKSAAFGKWFNGGNVYYNWPSWLPALWVSVTKLPLSVFNLKLEDYQGYDNGKVPFVVDVTAFFVINDPIQAAEKISNFKELEEQLVEVLRGAVRKILSQNDIISIMESRSEMGQSFYEEVVQQVKERWIQLKNIEFMDITDADGSEVIFNIMQKKKASIESESRVQVAEQMKLAKIAEDNAQKEAQVNSIKNREAEQARQIESDKLLESKRIEMNRETTLQNEQAQKEILDAQKLTTEKEMAVKLVEEEKQAEIQKVKELIKAQEDKEKSVLQSEARKESMILEADGQRQAMVLNAEGKERDASADAMRIASIGKAEAESKSEIAKSLNTFDEASLQYLVKELEVRLSEKVDTEKAKALHKADIKIITTGGNENAGLEKFMDLFSAQWGANIGLMMDTLRDTVGQEKYSEFLQKVQKVVALPQSSQKKAVPKQTIKKTSKSK